MHVLKGGEGDQREQGDNPSKVEEVTKSQEKHPLLDKKKSCDKNTRNNIEGLQKNLK